VKRWRFLLAVSAAQLGLLLFHLGRENLWLDEVMSLSVAQGSWSSMLRVFRSLPEQHPLYYLLLRGWLIVGTSEAALRLFSAITAVATVWVFYFLMRRVRDEHTARVAALLMAFSPFFLYYGQEARMYALLSFLTVFNSFWFLTWQQTGGGGGDGTRAQRLWYVASAVCGDYTHFFFLFVLLAQLTFVTIRDWPRRMELRRVLGTQSVVGLAYLPWALLLLTHRPEPQSWKGVADVVFGIPYAVLRFSLGYSEFVANAGWQHRIVDLVVANAAVLGVGLGCFGTLATVGWRGLRRAGTAGSFLLCGLVVPMAAALAASVVVIMMGERYLMISFPFYIALLATGFVGLFRAGRRGRAVGFVLVAVYVVILGRTLVDYYFNPAFGKEQWAAAADLVRTNVQTGDLIVVHSGFALGAFTRYYSAPSTEPVVPSQDVTLRQLRSREQVWLVLAHTDAEDDYWRPLTGSHRIVVNRLFPHQSGIRVMCLRRRSDPPVATGEPGQ
jgi:mannosyltransferase